jgi:hypothetical protein
VSFQIFQVCDCTVSPILHCLPHVQTPEDYLEIADVEDWLSLQAELEDLEREHLEASGSKDALEALAAGMEAEESQSEPPHVDGSTAPAE